MSGVRFLIVPAALVALLAGCAGLNDYDYTIPFPAFPGAEGYGASASGGRGGRIIYVTNLNTEGPGSLQAACDTTGTRTVVFAVSGTIPGRIVITEPNLTIAGQTAPGDGICVHTVRMKDADNVILRNFRIRSQHNDAFEARGCTSVILDHISASWGTDEAVSFRWSNDVTVQWCLMAEGQRPHSMGSITDAHPMSIHHSIYAHFDCRMPRLAGGPLDLRNNVIYNYGKEPVYTAYDDGSEANIVANYFKEGPSTPRGLQPTGYRPGCPVLMPGPSVKIYLADNFYAGRPDRTRNNWRMASAYRRAWREDEPPGFWATPAEIREACELDQPLALAPVSTDPAETAYEKALAYAGALPRDSLDRRVIEEVRNGTGRIPEESHRAAIADGTIPYPALESAPAPTDTDLDGMPDEWEIRCGLNPNEAAEHSWADQDNDGYTDVEEYLNRTDPTEYIDYRKPENNRHSLH
ncbi:pectate lyase [Candidatus Sumerlaeota bacterium]|nr:pectate lyase [Candidatus Sumerlaeota bacterium]